jgi:hypothetical protein
LPSRASEAQQRLFELLETEPARATTPISRAASY